MNQGYLCISSRFGLRHFALHSPAGTARNQHPKQLESRGSFGVARKIKSVRLNLALTHQPLGKGGLRRSSVHFRPRPLASKSLPSPLAKPTCFAEACSASQEDMWSSACYSTMPTTQATAAHSAKSDARPAGRLPAWLRGGLHSQTARFSLHGLYMFP